MLSLKAGFNVLMTDRLDCIQTLLKDPCLMRLVKDKLYIYIHKAFFAHYNTIALKAESAGGLHTSKMKAIQNEFHIRKKQVACSLVISFVAWVLSTVAPFCSLPGPCKCMLYFISVYNHHGLSPVKCSIVCFPGTKASIRINPACMLREFAQGCLKDLSRWDLNS